MNSTPGHNPISHDYTIQEHKPKGRAQQSVNKKMGSQINDDMHKESYLNSPTKQNRAGKNEF